MKKYLLDTHTIIWGMCDEKKLPKKVKNLLLTEQNILFLSYASVWEMSLKISNSKLKLPTSLPQFVERCRVALSINTLPLELEDFYKLDELPLHHRDPFDRVLITQAKLNSLSILSADSSFDQYSVKRIWD